MESKKEIKCPSCKSRKIRAQGETPTSKDWTDYFKCINCDSHFTR